MASTAPQQAPSPSVYGYLRVSGKGQLDGDGFPRQKAAITKYATGNGLRVTAWYEEKAVPGKTEWAQRPAWVDMLTRMQARGSITTIVIEKLDRLARDLMVQEHIIADLKQRGVTLISVAEPDLCSDDPTRKLLRQVMGAIAEYDRAMLVLKLAAARARHRQPGESAWGPRHYGHKPGEDKAIQRIRQLVAVGPYTYQAICDVLNCEGYLTRHGKRWQPTQVWRIIRRDKRQQRAAATTAP
jgi:DNA invertase Pin-like site-specific DNA recombinase